jgi:hypothetical protein
LALARLPLLRSVPAVQAAILHRYFLAEKQLAEALRRAYPDTLDPPAAAAVVGALMGAVLAAALVSLEHNGTADQVEAAVRSAMDIAIGGLRTVGRGARRSASDRGLLADEPAPAGRRNGE